MNRKEITKVILNTIFSNPRLVKETPPPPLWRANPVPLGCNNIKATRVIARINCIKIKIFDTVILYNNYFLISNERYIYFINQ